MNVFGVAARYLAGGYYLFATPLEIGIAGGSAVIDPIVTDLLLFALHTDDDGPSLVVVWGCAPVRQPRNEKNCQIVVRFFVKHVNTETLLGVAVTIFGTKPPARLSELLGQRSHQVGDFDRIGFFSCDSPQVVHILVESVREGHCINLP